MKKQVIVCDQCECEMRDVNGTLQKSDGLLVPTLKLMDNGQEKDFCSYECLEAYAKGQAEFCKDPVRVAVRKVMTGLESGPNIKVQKKQQVTLSAEVRDGEDGDDAESEAS